LKWSDLPEGPKLEAKVWPLYNQEGR